MGLLYVSANTVYSIVSYDVSTRTAYQIAERHQTSLRRMITPLSPEYWGRFSAVWSIDVYAAVLHSLLLYTSRCSHCLSICNHRLSLQTSPYLTLRVESTNVPPHLTHLPLDKMATISQTIFSDIFSWKKSFVFWLFTEVCTSSTRSFFKFQPCCTCITMTSHERHGVSNHEQLDRLLNSLFRPKTTKTEKHCYTGHLWADRWFTQWVDSPHKGSVVRRPFHVMTQSSVVFHPASGHRWVVWCSHTTGGRNQMEGIL